jgi:hypothetical protein
MEAFMRTLVSVIALVVALAWPAVGEAKNEAKGKKSTARHAATVAKKPVTRPRAVVRQRAAHTRCAGYVWWGCVGWDPDPNVRATLVRDYADDP